MKNPALILQPNAHWIADILRHFENNEPLNNDHLGFLLRHEKTLANHDLDLVFKHYLSAHESEPKQVLSFTFPDKKIDTITAHHIKNTVQNLLKKDLTHVDLKMSVDQFLQFKAVGLHELVYWHGPHFLSRTAAFANTIPQIIYLQWGRLFGVVKLNNVSDSCLLDGYVLIYFEDMSLRSMNQCVLDYAKHHQLEFQREHQHQLGQTPTQQNTPEPSVEHHPPTPGFHIIHSDNKGDCHEK